MKKHFWFIFLSALCSVMLFQNFTRIESGPYRNQSVIGKIEQVTPDGYACGWALDLNFLATSVSVQARIDMNLLVNPSSDLYRSDINQAFKTEGLHGYCFKIPESFFDGKEHSLSFYANSLELQTIQFKLKKTNHKNAIMETGGSNFAFIRHTTDAETPNPLLDPVINPWKNNQEPSSTEPAMLNCSKNGRSIISTYHLYKDEIDLMLKRLHDSGQRKIALVMWHTSVPAASWLADWNKPCLAVPTRGVVSAQIQKNIQEITQKIRRLGFKELIFRFSPVDIPRYSHEDEIYAYINPEDPNLSWGTCQPKINNRKLCDPTTVKPMWNEKSFQDNWNVLVNTRRIILQALDSNACKDSVSPCSGHLTRTRVTFDLALEYGGSWFNSSVLQIKKTCPSFPNITNIAEATKAGCLSDSVKALSQLQKDYASRIWRNYIANFSNQDTIGFTTVPAFTNSVASTFDVYDLAGPSNRPFRYGFDIYGNTAQKDPALLLASMGRSMDIIQQELALRNETHKDVYIVESYFNSASVRDLLRQRRQMNRQRWLAVMQWPLWFNSAEPSHNNVNDLSPYNHYRPN